MTKTYKPKNVASAMKWWTKMKNKGSSVWWNSETKSMMATDEADLRNVGVKDLSKLARVRSEADISRLLKSIWKPTASSFTGMVIFDGCYYRQLSPKERTE